MHGLYGINRTIIRDFLSAAVHGDGAQPAWVDASQPALVIVYSKTWHFYGALLELEDPFMTTPYLFAWNEPDGIVLAEDFPGRNVYYYYQDDPGALYIRPK